jgi:hypothetical protein
VDADLGYKLYRAFHLGARAMLSLDGKQISNEQVKRLRELLIAIASGESTLHDLGTDQMRNPAIADFIADVGSLPVKNDRETSEGILQYWKA